jgi:hypothetical protein
MNALIRCFEVALSRDRPADAGVLIRLPIDRAAAADARSG